MRQVVAVFVLCCGSLLGQASVARAGCDGARPESGAQYIEVDGVRRIFVVRWPSGLDGPTPAAVVFAFHPFGMSAQYMQSRASIARAWREAVAVYPEAAGRSRAWQVDEGGDANGDLKFFDAMVSWLEAHGCIDRAKVFALGYSNGAQFAHRLACDRPASVAGIAVAAGRLPCTPAAATPVIFSHGLADNAAPYRLAIDASRVWSERNACVAPPSTGSVGCFTAEACPQAGTGFCTHDGGHEYDPSFTARAVEFFRRAR